MTLSVGNIVPFFSGRVIMKGLHWKTVYRGIWGYCIGYNVVKAFSNPGDQRPSRNSG